ncbi:MAG: DUF2474 domain-containing protein [Gammaproteobacteria bacterium]
MAQEETSRRLWLRRFGWLVLIWTASIGVLAVFALLLRLLMNAAGMTS